MTAAESYTIDLTAICVRADTIRRHVPCSDVFQRFAADPALFALAIVDDDTLPVGVIDRYRFMSRLADALGRSLFEQKPIAHLMDQSPLIVERRVDVQTVTDLVFNASSDATAPNFIVVEDGHYFGLGSTVGLMRIMADHLRHQTLEADAARREAERAVKGKTRFLANMTHELRTPLNGVIGFGQLLEAEVHGPLGAPEYAAYARDIVASGQHLIGIINDILDLAKIEAGRITLHERFVDLRDLAGRSLRMVAPIAADKHISLHSELGATPWTVRADERRLQQAIVNLLSNAIKFTPKGGEAGVRVDADRGWAWLEIWDTGIGIKQEDLRRLFKPFEQLEDAGERPQEGTGLGLTITKALMQAHGGEVLFESEVGKGTAVRLMIPRSRLLADKFAWSVQSRVEFIDPPESEAV